MSDDPTQQHVSARQHQILDAAAAVFAEKGFHATTTKDIARRAGVAEGTIYNYFASKSALLFGILDRLREAALRDADLSTMDVSDVRGTLAASFRHPLMALKADNFALFRIVMSEMMANAELRAQYAEKILEPSLGGTEALFQGWRAHGLIRDVDVALTLRAITGVIMGLIWQAALGDATLQAEWDALPEFLADLMLDGIAGGAR